MHDPEPADTPLSDVTPADLLPDVTSDERDEGWGERPEAGDADDERLRREVPPHHGG